MMNVAILIDIDAGTKSLFNAYMKIKAINPDAECFKDDFVITFLSADEITERAICDAMDECALNVDAITITKISDEMKELQDSYGFVTADEYIERLN